MNFSSVIKSNYSQREQKSLSKALHSTGLFEPLKSDYNEYFKALALCRNEDRLSLFEKMVLYIMALITLWYRGEAEGEQRTQQARIITHFGYLLVREAVMMAKKDMDAHLNLIARLLKTQPLEMELGIFIAHLMGGEVIHCFHSMRQSNKADKKSHSVNPYVHLIWHTHKNDKKKQINRDVMISDMVETLDGVTPYGCIARLFSTSFCDYTIIVPLRHLRAFLALFRMLRDSGRLSCSCNKGMFHLLQAHIVAAPGEKKYESREFCKIDYETRNNKILNEEAMIKIIQLTDLYCLITEEELTNT
jgi:hypothetical protein